MEEIHVSIEGSFPGGLCFRMESLLRVVNAENQEPSDVVCRAMTAGFSGGNI
jgi:hypothetical protein